MGEVTACVMSGGSRIAARWKKAEDTKRELDGLQFAELIKRRGRPQNFGLSR